MNPLIQKRAIRTRGRTASWQDYAHAIDPEIKRALRSFEMLGYRVLLQSDIVSGRYQGLLQGYYNGILSDRFYPAMAHINPDLSRQQIDAVFRQITAPRSMPILQQNRQWHLQLLHGIPVPASHQMTYPPQTLKLLDFSDFLNNDWLVIYSFPVIDKEYQHCVDLAVFVNGLPLAMVHGLHAGGKAWSLRMAYLQLQEYQAHLPRFFSLNELIVLSNGFQARIGTLSYGWKQFTVVPSPHGPETAISRATELETLIQSVFQKQHLLDVIQRLIAFRQSQANLAKKLHSIATVS